MVYNRRHFIPAWLVGAVCILVSAILTIYGCQEKEYDVNMSIPEGTTPVRVTLKLGNTRYVGAKATALTIDTVAIDEGTGMPLQEPEIDPISISNPNLPLSVSIPLYTPPCTYRFTVGAALSRDPAPTPVQQDFNVCQGRSGSIEIDVLEEFQGQLVILAPTSALSGETLTIGCQLQNGSAPDIAEWPLTLTLSESGGNEESDTFGSMAIAIEDEFFDPYPSTSSELERIFTCTVEDGHSVPQSVQHSVYRILSTSTVTPTPSVTPTPRLTPIP